MNYFRTAMLLAALTALFMGVGYVIGGQSGMMIALVIAGAMNIFSYWNSDKMVLSMHHAQEVDERSAPELFQMVRQLAANAELPMPKVYIINNPQPNAFATGRNPENAAVAATTGLLGMLDRAEIRGVMAHELAHVKNRDTLTMTVTATIAGAIGMLANFAMFFGPRDEEGRPNPIAGLLIMILAPIAASLVQMAISRAREYEADRVGAEIAGDPESLARALQKIEAYAHQRVNMDAERNPAMAHLFIINPLSGRGADNLFSTHPATRNRVAQLMQLAQQFGQAWRAPAAQTQSGAGPWGQRRKGPWG